MKQLRASLFLALLLPTLVSSAAARERKVFYPKAPSARLKEIAEAIADTKTARVAPESLPAARGYFVRITERRHILAADDSLKDGAGLHVRPFVFITTPEGLYGRSLLEVFTEIGYESESILAQQLGRDTVAVVFRYPGWVALSEVRDGRLPADWGDKVFVPTWENVFELFQRLAQKDAATARCAARTSEADKPAARALTLSGGELDFVINFPEEGKRRVRGVPYGGLKAAGGADWFYRRLLENQLSVFEHFRGNGRTQNELVDQDGALPERGLMEYVGPNMKIKDLAEVAIVDLGRLAVGAEHGRWRRRVGPGLTNPRKRRSRQTGKSQTPAPVGVVLAGLK